MNSSVTSAPGKATPSSSKGEVVAAAADARIFANGRWSFRDDNGTLQTIHYLGGGNFIRTGGTLRARPP